MLVLLGNGQLRLGIGAALLERNRVLLQARNVCSHPHAIVVASRLLFGDEISLGVEANKGTIGGQ